MNDRMEPPRRADARRPPDGDPSPATARAAPARSTDEANAPAGAAEDLRGVSSSATLARRRRALRWTLLVIVPLFALIAGGAFWLLGGRYVETDNAFVKADKVPVSAEVSGAVVEVLVVENQIVQAGQPLFRLDPVPFRVALSKAEAKLGQVRTDLAAMKASYREKQAQIALARTQLEFARKEQARQADLAARNFISASKLDDARKSVEIAQQQLQAQQQDLQRIAASLGGGIDLPAESHPSYRAALAELEQARLDLSRVEVRASLDGTVSHLPKPGQFLAAGATAASLVADARPWIEANFPEKDLTYVHPGQPVRVQIDTYPDRDWTGVVESLSPATGSEFSIIPAQNASGNWVKVAQRVPLRVRLDAQPDAPRLRAGMSATVRVDTGHRRTLFGFSF
ncbi:MAG: HlyD family secretion protein [Burkholderiaceae bacterium]|nr:HlyD family secretion protein [Burkholderiaceae bacterium]